MNVICIPRGVLSRLNSPTMHVYSQSIYFTGFFVVQISKAKHTENDIHIHTVESGVWNDIHAFNVGHESYYHVR